MVQIRLGGGYGFLFSDRMLEEHPYLWVREMGIYISRLGTWEATEKQRTATAALIQRSLERPYLSCAEKYYQWTGYVEQGKECMFPIPTKTGARTGLDDKIWDFVKEKETWPAEARSLEHVKRMPEVDTTYFTDRFPDLQYFRMYFGWPDHDDRFSIWNNGKVGISSNSVAGDPKKFPNLPWLPRASGYTIQFGVGAAPRFRQYGDEAVRQHLKNGYDLMPVTEWSDAGMKVEQTNFAYPVDGEQLKTGIEPLINWTAVRITNQKPHKTDTYLGIEISDEDFSGSKPLDDFRDLSWRKEGGFFHRDSVLVVTDPELEFEEVPTVADAHEIHDSDIDKEWTHSLQPVHIRRFRARIRIPASQTKTYTFANFYRAISSTRLADVRNVGYRTALKKTTDSWDRLQGQGASITVPDSLLNNLYRTFLPRITINAQLDINGYSLLQTGPIFINRIWPHVVATAVADYLAPRGYFDLAKLYMEPFFHWQGTSAGWPAIRDWNGFFGVPPVYSGVIWMMHHGVFQWGCARYYQLSGDRAWLNEKLPALLKSMDWVKSNRTLTKKLNTDGSRQLNYGWLPPGQVGDADFGTAIQSDSHNWRGMHFLTDVLESIGHPRAAEFRAETQDYYECLRDRVGRATAERPIVRLNDDTWVPYIPAFLEGHPPDKWSPPCGMPRWWTADGKR